MELLTSLVDFGLKPCRDVLWIRLSHILCPRFFAQRVVLPALTLCSAQIRPDVLIVDLIRVKKHRTLLWLSRSLIRGLLTTCEHFIT